MKYFKITMLSLVGIFFLACEQESITTLETQTPVVDGFLFAGQPVDSIQITQSFSYSSQDTTINTLDDLSVQIMDENNLYDLVSVGNGLYQNKSLIIQEDKTYSLSFEFNNQLVQATTYIPQKKEATISTNSIDMEKIGLDEFPFGSGFSFPDPIEVTWENPEGDYYYILVQNIEENPEYINERLEDPDFPLRRFSFITEPEITDFFVIDPRRQIQQFGTHQIIVFRVNPEYAGLYEVAGTTSNSIAQPPSNVENGLGIFTGVSSDTLILEVRKI